MAAGGGGAASAEAARIPESEDKAWQRIWEILNHAKLEDLQEFKEILKTFPNLLKRFEIKPIDSRRPELISLSQYVINLDLPTERKGFYADYCESIINNLVDPMLLAALEASCRNCFDQAVTEDSFRSDKEDLIYFYRERADNLKTRLNDVLNKLNTPATPTEGVPVTEATHTLTQTVFAPGSSEESEEFSFSPS
jgi:hypothetical protein